MNYEKIADQFGNEKATLLQQTAEAEHGGSLSGYHFVSGFIQNPYGFYLRYVRGYVPIYTKPPLIKGGVIHDALYLWYKTFDPDFALLSLEKLFDERAREYEDEQKFREDKHVSLVMLTDWLNTWAELDKDRYEIIAIEQTLQPRLPNGFTLTIRPDIILRDLELDEHIIMDHKTTGYSIDASYRSVEGQDQATAYLWGTQQVLGISSLGLYADIMYSKGKVVRSQRRGPVIREPYELHEFEQEMMGALIEMAQKVKSLPDYDPHFLFPRNGKDETMFGGDWGSLYRAKLPDDPTIAPEGYKIDQSINLNNFIKRIEEQTNE